MLGKQAGEVFLFLADNVEFVCQSSHHLLLDSILFSEKLQSVSSVKLYTICLSSGLLIWRAPLLGGGAKEITPMEQFLKSDDFKRVRERYLGRILAFVDRGFANLPLELGEAIHLLHPGVQELRGQYTAEHATWKQVCIVFYKCTHSLVAITHPQQGGGQQSSFAHHPLTLTRQFPSPADLRPRMGC